VPRSDDSRVLTVRVPVALDRLIERAARRVRGTKSAVMREALQSVFGGQRPPEDPATEARRQSLLVSGRASEREALEFVEHAADPEGWK